MTHGWIPAVAAHASQSVADASRWTCVRRLISADASGRASALSVARLPAPMTMLPSGNS